MTAQALTTTREVDSRTGDGIHVRLLWDELDGRLFVAVADAKTGEAFYMEVRDPERTLEVFLHPYAYAAWYGVDTRAAAGDPAAESDARSVTLT